MKRLSTNAWLIGSLIGASALLGLDSIRAQDPNALKRAAEAQIDGQKAKLDAQKAQLDAQKAQIREKTQKFSAELAAKAVAGVRMRTNVADAIRTAAAAVHDAKDDEAKVTAQKSLDDQLSKFFDDDMVRREQELKQIEERLTKLRELLDRRRARKQDIVELQTKVALNEVEGLGFYDNDASRGVFGGNFRYGTPLVSPEPFTISVPVGGMPPMSVPADNPPPIPAPASDIPAPAAKPQPAPATKPASKPRASSSGSAGSSSSSSSSNENSVETTVAPESEQ